MGEGEASEGACGGMLGDDEGSGWGCRGGDRLQMWGEGPKSVREWESKGRRLRKMAEIDGT